MQSFEVVPATDFSVYRQVVRGAFNPVTVTKSAFKSSLTLVRSANTCVVCSAPAKEETAKLVSSFDLTALGYYSTDDIDISYSFDHQTNTYQAVIRPRMIYPLNENISLPVPPDAKAKFFLEFFADEFERVKIRAAKSMIAASSVENARYLSCRNLQLLRMLFNDARFAFNAHSVRTPANLIQSDLYIYYVLNLFIIRCIVFYAEFFKPFLNEEPPVELTMRNSFHNEMPRMLKYPWLFNHRPPLYELLSDYKNPLQLSEGDPSYNNLSEFNAQKIPDALLKEAMEILQLKGSIKLNCPSNAFINEFYKMIYEYKFEKKPWLSAETIHLIRILKFACIDNEGQPLNPATIRSVLKPSNAAKRPGYKS